MNVTNLLHFMLLFVGGYTGAEAVNRQKMYLLYLSFTLIVLGMELK